MNVERKEGQMNVKVENSEPLRAKKLNKAQVPSSHSAQRRTLLFDITMANTAVEHSFSLFAHGILKVHFNLFMPLIYMYLISNHTCSEQLFDPSRHRRVLGDYTFVLQNTTPEQIYCIERSIPKIKLLKMTNHSLSINKTSFRSMIQRSISISYSQKSVPIF